MNEIPDAWLALYMILPKGIAAASDICSGTKLTDLMVNFSLLKYNVSKVRLDLRPWLFPELGLICSQYELKREIATANVRDGHINSQTRDDRHRTTLALCNYWFLHRFELGQTVKYSMMNVANISKLILKIITLYIAFSALTVRSVLQWSPEASPGSSTIDDTGNKLL